MREKSALTRRALLAAKPIAHHISSAVVVALPARRDEISTQLAALPGVEVHADGGSRIVITIEGQTSSVLGETLLHIATMDGVLAANMVFEHIEVLEDRRS